MKRYYFPVLLVLLSSSCIVSFERVLLEKTEHRFNIEVNSELSFHNISGDLEVMEWDSNFVFIETSVFGDSSSDLSKDLEIAYLEVPEGLLVTVNKANNFNSYSVDFAVKVPADLGFTINHETVSGDTSINGTFIVSIESVSGDAFLNVLKVEDFSSVSGDLIAKLSNQDIPLVIETISGDITVEFSEELGIKIETISGSILIDGEEFDDEVNISSDKDVTASFETISGDITVSTETVFQNLK